VALWIAATFATAPQAQTSEVVTYYHTDAIGSIRMVTDANGQVIERHDYLPFGEEWQPSPSSERRLYSGKERDAETAFDYFGARYYASTAGRFTSVDPSHIDGDIFDPQRWNGFAYGRNNPLRFIDPFGFGECPASTDTSTCVEGDRWTTGEFTVDYFRFLAVALGNDYWNWRVSEPELMGASPFSPPVVGEETLLERILAGRSVRGASEAFHYTFTRAIASIEKQGLRPGTYATPNGTLSPLQAQIDLALPPNRGLRDALVRIDLAGLRQAGYEIPEVTLIARKFGMPGGGFEMQFPYAIPPQFIKIVRP
jgi:RHS repeat-associated protein